MHTSDNLLHGSAKYNKLLNKLCEPLHQFFGSNHLAYINITNEGKLLNLHTNVSWMERCIDQKYYLDDPSMINPKNIVSGFCFAKDHNNDDFLDGILNDCINNFDLNHTLIMFEKESNGYEAIGISASKKNLTFFDKVNANQDQLKRFISYFRESIAPINYKLLDYQIDFAKLKGELYDTQTPFKIDNKAKSLETRFC